MVALKIRSIGNSVGVILPKEILEALHAREGDVLFATATPDGVHLTPYDPDFEEEMRAFERVRRDYRNALHELAK